MDIKELEEIMVSEGIAIRAVPLKKVDIYEKYHIHEFPHGTIQYFDEFKREMLVVESIPEDAGKFILQTANHHLSIVKFNSSESFDSIEDAIKNYKEKNHMDKTRNCSEDTVKENNVRKYYEVEFGKQDNLEDTYSICIIGMRKPSIKEAEEFCKADMENLGYSHVTAVLEIDAEEAHRFFDMENEENFPIFA